MSEQHYDIFFRGEILDGFELDKVKVHVGQLFKATPEKVDALFSGKVIPLKKDLDKVTAAKFKQALEKAGAKIYIKLAIASETISAPAIPAATATISSNEDSKPIPVASASISEELPAEFIILPPGSDVLRADERPVVQAVKVDTSGIRMASVFDQPEENKTPPPPAPDVSHLSAAPVGADILAGVIKEPPPPAPLTDHLSIAAVGADLAELIEQMTPPPAPDVSHLSTAAVGADILEGVPKTPAPKAPDTSHINLLK